MHGARDVAERRALPYPATSAILTTHHRTATGNVIYGALREKYGRRRDALDSPADAGRISEDIVSSPEFTKYP